MGLGMGLVVGLRTRPLAREMEGVLPCMTLTELRGVSFIGLGAWAIFASAVA